MQIQIQSVCKPGHQTRPRSIGNSNLNANVKRRRWNDARREDGNNSINHTDCAVHTCSLQVANRLLMQAVRDPLNAPLTFMCRRATLAIKHSACCTVYSRLSTCCSNSPTRSHSSCTARCFHFLHSFYQCLHSYICHCR